MSLTYNRPGGDHAFRDGHRSGEKTAYITLAAELAEALRDPPLGDPGALALRRFYNQSLRPRLRRYGVDHA